MPPPILACAILLASFAVAAEEPAPERLRQIERAIEEEKARADKMGREASAIEREMAMLQKELVATARTTQEHEAEVAELESRLEQLRREEADKAASIELNRDRSALVLMGLARIARNPPEALMARPAPPADTVRGALLLRSALPRIESEARKLETELEQLSSSRLEISRRQTELAAAAIRLDRERGRLGSLLDRKRELHHQARTGAEEAAKKAGDLAGQASSLRELMDRLEKAKPAPPPRKPAPDAGIAAPDHDAPPFSRARGRLVFPAMGRIDGRYGEANQSGIANKGLSIRTRGNAQVVAPYGGIVVFADRFRGYGRLLIIDHGEGYHTLLAGLGRIDSSIGQTVIAGEPVGVMGRPDEGQPALYVELRRNGQPINPLPWLAAHGDKVDG